MEKKIIIPSEDRCPHCGHWYEGEGDAKRIYSKARAEWLETIAKDMLTEGGLLSDDGIVDWVAEHKKLLKRKE